MDVLCRQCSYLTAIVPSADPYEARSLERPLSLLERGHGMDAWPMCMVSAFNLWTEREGVHRDYPALPLIDQFAIVAGTPRRCTEFSLFEWGESPLEALRRRDMQLLERERRNWEQLLERERRAFEERLSARNEEFLQHLHDDNKAAENSAQDRDTRITRFFLVLAALEVVGTLVAVGIAVGQWVSQ